jgi:ribosomal protein L37AE/L43A
MGVISRAKRLVTGGESTAEEADADEEGDPTHVCESCGEEYHADPATDIAKCRACGGVKVSRV